jgi:hypothetical protein
MMPNADDQAICATCGHLKLLHKTLGGECDACDSPEVPIPNRCPGFTPGCPQGESDEA